MSAKEKIISSLENPNYQWRTITGVARETNLPESVVLDVINEQEDKIIQSTIPGKHGEKLFTTRRYFRQKSSPWKRLSGAFKNRAV